MEPEHILILTGGFLLAFFLGVLCGILLLRRRRNQERRKGFEQDLILTEKRVDLLRETAKLLKTIDDFHYSMRVKGEIEDLTKDKSQSEG